jgi:hypothetical protein
MGAGKSKPSIFSKGPTRESLLKSTQPMRVLMNAAFKLMIEQITTKDLLSMSSPSECSKYVIIMGQSFDKYFKSIDVMPVMKDEKEKRTIYFQKADILTGQRIGESEMAKAYAEQRKQVCLVLGYFFTRLFQIFAAIYFSVADDESIRPGVFVQDAYNILPGQLYGKEQGGPVLKPTEGVYFSGGGLPNSINLGRYDFLRPYLTEDPKYSNRFKMSVGKKEHFIYFQLEDSGYGRFILVDRLGDRTSDDYEGEKLLEVLCSLNISRTEQSITINTIKAREYEENIRLAGEYLKNVKIVFKQEQVESGEMRYMTRIGSGKGVPVGPPKSIYALLIHIGRNIKIASQQQAAIPPLSFSKVLGIEEEKKEILKEIKDPYNGFERGRDRGFERGIERGRDRGIERGFERGIEREPYRALQRNTYTDPYRRDVYDRLLRDRLRKREGDKDKEKDKLGLVYSALQPGQRPVPHCVARSLQLLNVDALTDLGGKKAFTYICKTKFLGSHPTGLPAPNEALSKSPGLNTLMALFHEFGDKDQSDIIKRQRLEALNILASLYKNSTTISDTDFVKLANKYDPMICNTRGFKDEPISLTTPSKFAAAKNGVLQLWNIQLQHVKNIESLVREMFVVNKAGALIINPQLMTIGIEGLDLISQKLRSILLAYYGNCEKTYQDTVGKLVGV